MSMGPFPESFGGAGSWGVGERSVPTSQLRKGFAMTLFPSYLATLCHPEAQALLKAAPQNEADSVWGRDFRARARTW